MKGPFRYAGESPFWYFLARRSEDHAKGTLPPLLRELNGRAHDLSLPIHYPEPHAIAWALACQLFQVTSPHAEATGRYGFSVMLVGFDHLLLPKGFAGEAYGRILHNFKQPAFPDRTRAETIVDTFLVNGMDQRTVDPSEGDVILQHCLTDPTMLVLGQKAVQPVSNLWETTVADYERRRPGYFRRTFTNVNAWLFD